MKLKQWMAVAMSAMVMMSSFLKNAGGVWTEQEKQQVDESSVAAEESETEILLEETVNVTRSSVVNDVNAEQEI